MENHTEYDEALATQSQRDPPGAFQGALQKCHGTWSEKVYLVSSGRKLLVLAGVRILGCENPRTKKRGYTKILV